MKKKDITSHRRDKAASLIHAAVMEVLRNGRMLDRRLIGCPLSITRVTVTADLKLAYCYFLPFNTSLREEDLLEALSSSMRAIRAMVTEKINLKYSPELRFFYDESFDNANKVESLLMRINTEGKEG